MLSDFCMSMQINLQHVFKMSASWTHACFESHMPLVNGCVDDVLFNAAPNIQQTLPQFANISNLCLEDVLLHCSPDFVIHRVKIWTVQWTLFRWNSPASLDVRAQLSHEHCVLEHCPAETRTHSLISAIISASAAYRSNKHRLFHPRLDKKKQVYQRRYESCHSSKPKLH